MNAKNITFETIRWASIAAMLAVVSYGFFTPISFIQALVYNPMLLIGLLGVIGYASGRLEGMNETADIHNISLENEKVFAPLCKAA
jgi:hypothetical protein